MCVFFSQNGYVLGEDACDEAISPVRGPRLARATAAGAQPGRSLLASASPTEELHDEGVAGGGFLAALVGGFSGAAGGDPADVAAGPSGEGLLRAGADQRQPGIALAASGQVAGPDSFTLLAEVAGGVVGGVVGSGVVGSGETQAEEEEVADPEPGEAVAGGSGQLAAGAASAAGDGG